MTAVDAVDLTVAPGEIVAFLGPNGAGKTTTVDMLLGLTTPTAGTVEVYGEAPGRAVAAGRVSAVMQTGGLLPDFTVARDRAGDRRAARPPGPGRARSSSGPGSPRSPAAGSRPAPAGSSSASSSPWRWSPTRT